MNSSLGDWLFFSAYKISLQGANCGADTIKVKVASTGVCQGPADSLKDQALSQNKGTFVLHNTRTGSGVLCCPVLKTKPM